MKYIVTGGAGFIGSCIVRMLNDLGCDDIIIVDDIASTEKWKNIRNKKFSEYVQKDRFLAKLPDLHDVSAIIHMGACSSTTEKDFDYLYANNFEYTKALWKYCTEKNISFLYASSAATYGDGVLGFDDKSDITRLIPLNGYGYSKQLFDLWAEKQTKCPPQHVGMKFFNVYGPNEYCKGTMASVIFHSFNSVMKDGKIRLFKSYRRDYADGEQLRDFVYVKDICSVIKFFLEHQKISGLFNLGTGHAETFNTLASSVFDALGRKPVVDYIEMPESLQPKYQYFTEAKMNKLKDAGYDKSFVSLRDGTRDYVQGHLLKDYLVY
jgi:ADP-L-glycero-D-manno-heptose 6-epimerase